MGDKVVSMKEHDKQTVEGVQVWIIQEIWKSGGNSFSVHRVIDDVDLTAEVYGECYDRMPTDAQLSELVTHPDMPAVLPVIWTCNCGRTFREGSEDQVGDHYNECD